MSSAAPTETGYLTDLEYTGNFYPFLAPARLAYAAAINGYRAPSLERFTWCELGCGKGITALLLAALHPQGEFIGCDLNPAHIEQGEALRRDAGVDNLRLLAKSVAQLLQEDVPPCDFIVLHGLYGWVPLAVREDIHAFLRRCLKPGGLVFVSYNTLPGWAHLQPLREMMRLFAEHVPGDTVGKLRGAFERVQFLADNNAAFFRELPAAAEHLHEMAGRDLRYLAHEYLTPHGNPFYFADVARAMAADGLAYAGSTNPRDNYAELMAPAVFDGLLAEVRSRIELESLRDIIVNTRFRRDVYAAQPAVAGRAAPVTLAAFAGLAFTLTGLPEKLPLGCDDGALAFNLEPEHEAVAAIHSLLARGPATAESIHETAARATGEETATLIQKLVVAGHLDPCTRPQIDAGWPRLNAVLVEAAIERRLPEIPLACPRMGSASNSETLHAAALEACVTHADVADAIHSLLARLRRLNRPVWRQSASGTQEAVDDGGIAAHVTQLWRELHDPASAGARLTRFYGLQS